MVKEIGEALRRAREERGMTLQDVHEATKIRIHYLQAIEDGKFDELPGEVYLKGFLWRYAETVGLNGQEVIDKYKAWQSRLQKEAGVEGVTRRASQGKRSHGLVRRAPLSRASRGRANVLQVLLLSTLICAMLVAASYYSSRRGEGPKQGSALQAPDVAGGEKTPEEQQVAREQVEPQVARELITGQPSPGVQEAPGGAHELQVVVRERCWVRVVADGKTVFERTMLKGEAMSWTARREFQIKVGNAGGIEVSFDGSPPEAMGKRGEVVERRFP